MRGLFWGMVMVVPFALWGGFEGDRGRGLRASHLQGPHLACSNVLQLSSPNSLCSYFPFVRGPAIHVVSPAFGDGAVTVGGARLRRAMSVKLENIWLYSRSNGSHAGCGDRVVEENRRGWCSSRIRAAPSTPPASRVPPARSGGDRLP